jgi:hypothetical protein
MVYRKLSMVMVVKAIDPFTLRYPVRLADCGV